jgi:hypothetical protein
MPEGPAILASMEVSDLEPADSHSYEPAKLFLERFAREVHPIEPGQSPP